MTIPGPIRRKAGLLPGTEVEFVEDERGILLRLSKSGRRSNNCEREVGDALERLRGSATIKMTTEEIMALTRGG